MLSMTHGCVMVKVGGGTKRSKTGGSFKFIRTIYVYLFFCQMLMKAMLAKIYPVAPKHRYDHVQIPIFSRVIPVNPN
jgi:hypothetical protein